MVTSAAGQVQATGKLLRSKADVLPLSYITNLDHSTESIASLIYGRVIASLSAEHVSLYKVLGVVVNGNG